jgi:hypothetical protein
MSDPEQKPAWLYRICSGLLLGVTVFFPLELLGAEQSAEAVQPAEPPQPTIQTTQPAQPAQPSSLLSSMDAERDYLSGKIISFATDIDRFFGDQRNYQETNNSVMQLDLDRVTGYSGDRKFSLSARANLNLPATEKRLHLLLESNPDQNIEGAPAQNQFTPLNNQVNTPQSYGLALRYEQVKEELKASHFNADAGLKFQGIKINPFVRTSVSYSIPLDQWRLKAWETVYWFNTIGAGETTQVDLEHILSPSVMFRATSSATWLKDTPYYNLRQDLSLYHTVDERTALLYQLSALGVSSPQWQTTMNVASIFYRYRLHQQWMYFELSPQLYFPRTNNFQSAFTLSMRLEVLLDQSR